MKWFYLIIVNVEILCDRGFMWDFTGVTDFMKLEHIGTNHFLKN